MFKENDSQLSINLKIQNFEKDFSHSFKGQTSYAKISDTMSSGSQKLAIKQNNTTGIYDIAPIAFYCSKIEECLRQVPTYVYDASDNFIFIVPVPIPKITVTACLPPST